MKGNDDFYRSETLRNEKELRKLKKAKSKHLKIIQSLEREIHDKEKTLQQNMHCLSVVSAYTEQSYII